MKMPNAHAVSTSGPMEGFTAAQIAPENMALAMRMFSSNYSRPKDAVLRELAANGLDSQREAGVSTPIQITLPTIDHPELRISDEGLGLSVDDILKTFGNYLDSTKRDSVTQHGTFGIGSKAPHAVADQYHVTAIKDGVRALVLFAKRDGGIPGHKIISTEPTDAPNGVTVTVPVGMGNVDGWLTAAERTFYWWDPATIAVRAEGDEPIEMDSYLHHIDESQSTDSVRFVNGRRGSVVRIGTIGYEIPSAMWSEQEISFNSPLVFEIDLDTEVTIAHSRESIEDTAEGRAVLRKLFLDWKAELDVRYQRDLDRAQTTHEVLIIEKKMNNDVRYNTFGSLRRLWALLDEKRLPTAKPVQMVRFFGQGPRDSVELGYGLLELMSESRCVVGVLDDKEIRAMRKWRKAHGHPTVFVIPNPSTLMPLIDPTVLSWLTIDEMVSQTPKEPARRRRDEDPIFSVITGAKPRESVFEQIEVDTDEIAEAIEDGAVIVAGTKAEYDEIVMDRHHWILGSDPDLGVDHLRNALKIMRAGRSVASVAKLLGTEVLSPIEYRNRLRHELVQNLSKKGRQRLAEHSRISSHEVDLLKRSSNQDGLTPAVKKTLVGIRDLLGEKTARTHDELLQTEPSLPEPTLHKQYPLLMEVLYNRIRTPSAELLNALIRVDESNQKMKKGSA